MFYFDSYKLFWVVKFHLCIIIKLNSEHERYWKTFKVLLMIVITVACSFTAGVMLPIYYDREFSSNLGVGFFIGGFYIL